MHEIQVDNDGNTKRTLSVPEAGKLYFNLSRNGSYEAARRGELPVIEILNRLRVPVAALERMLDEAKPRTGDERP